MVRTFNSVYSAELIILKGRNNDVYVWKVVIHTEATTSIQSDEVRKWINTEMSVRLGFRLTRPGAMIK